MRGSNVVVWPSLGDKPTPARRKVPRGRVPAAWSADILVGRAGDSRMRGAQRRRPAFAQVVKVRLPRLDAKVELGVAGVAPRDQDVDRQAARGIWGHGG